MTTNGEQVPVGVAQVPQMAHAEGGLVDTRLVQKPDKLKNEEQWLEWRFVFENYLACVAAEFSEELELAARSTGHLLTSQNGSSQRSEDLEHSTPSLPQLRRENFTI